MLWLSVVPAGVIWNHSLEHGSSEEQKEPNTFIGLFKLVMVCLGQCSILKNIYQG